MSQATLDCEVTIVINHSHLSSHNQLLCIVYNFSSHIDGTTWVHNLKENGQVNNSPIDRIKNFLVKKENEKVAKKKSSPVRILGTCPR